MAYTIIASGTNPTDERSICILHLDDQGKLASRRDFSGEEYPGFLAVSGNFVCAATRENIPGVSDDTGEPKKRPVIACYTLEQEVIPGAGENLVPLMRTHFEGVNICHVSINSAKRLVGGACYTSGDATVWGYDENGLTRELFHKNYNLPDTVSHPHCMRPCPDGSMYYLVDLGLDRVTAFACEGETVREAGILPLHKGDGPRQIFFHPTLDIAYLITEYSNIVYTLRRDPKTGELTVCQRLSTLPEGYAAESFGAALAFEARTGRLYASNRGMNSIAVYETNDAGLLRNIGYADCGGIWPRHIALTEDGRFLLACNERSDMLCVLPIGEDGMPGAAVEKIPVCGSSFALEL
jgi:6-phosphogluconolactonase